MISISMGEMLNFCYNEKMSKMQFLSEKVFFNKNCDSASMTSFRSDDVIHNFTLLWLGSADVHFISWWTSRWFMVQDTAKVLPLEIAVSTKRKIQVISFIDVTKSAVMLTRFFCLICSDSIFPIIIKQYIKRQAHWR